jgi:hypothetical protein
VLNICESCGYHPTGNGTHIAYGVLLGALFLSSCIVVIGARDATCNKHRLCLCFWDDWQLAISHVITVPCQTEDMLSGLGIRVTGAIDGMYISAATATTAA